LKLVRRDRNPAANDIAEWRHGRDQESCNGQNAQAANDSFPDIRHQL
jgi:hypothetical protein